MTKDFMIYVKEKSVTVLSIRGTQPDHEILPASKRGLIKSDHPSSDEEATPREKEGREAGSQRRIWRDPEIPAPQTLFKDQKLSHPLRICF